jgi:ornithine carbamoyltransferase
VIEVTGMLKGRDFTSILGWTRAELEQVLDLADELKAARTAGLPTEVLPGRTVGLIFQKPSTRTRVSFEAGVAELGSTALHLAASDLQLGRGEPIRDTAYVLSRYLGAIMIRTFAQADVDELAEHASIPVVNGLTDEEHPCQALADVMTMRERFGALDGLRVGYVGDGNHVCVSLMQACARLGARFVAATPGDYQPPRDAVREAAAKAERAGGSVDVVEEAADAATGAQVLYTDVWTSMGQEAERSARMHAFGAYAITPRLLELATPDAIVLHCLPAHAGEEIAAEVLYGPQSAVWDEAENRLHAQKALLALIVP